MKKSLKSMALIAAVVALSVPLYARVGTENVLKRSFNVSPGGTARVQTELGSIEVTTHDANTVEAQVIRRVPYDDPNDVNRILDNFEVSFDQKGDEVSVTARRQNKSWMFHDAKLKVRIVLTVPRKFDVELRTSGGNISVSDLEGEVDTRTSGGNLKLGRIFGPVTAKTSGGNIDLAESRGDADVDTSGGNITIGDVQGDLEAHTSGGNIDIQSVTGSLGAKTSGGNISIDDARGNVTAITSGGDVTARLRAQPTAESRLHTSGGSITVYLAKNIAVDLNARASGGSVRTDIPMLVEGKIDRSSVTGKINGGGPNLILSSSGGAVEIKNL